MPAVIAAIQFAPGLVLATTGRASPVQRAVESFEQYGFTRGQQVGKHAWIVTRAVDPV